MTFEQFCSFNRHTLFNRRDSFYALIVQFHIKLGHLLSLTHDSVVHMYANHVSNQTCTMLCGFFQVQCWIFLCFGNFKLYILGEKKNLHFRLAMAVQHSTIPIALIKFIVSLRN